LSDTPAFGTGLHPTTVLCLEAIDDAVAQHHPGAVLDVGTGSGVLALAALRLGVPRVVGLDVDPEAIRTAATNARLNALAARLHLVHGGPAALRGAWPLVVANLLTGPLLELAPDLVRRVGRRGHLVLSGIRSSTERDVVDAYRRWGMERLAASTREGWVALLFQASW
jgi:ribosomal protein L11 methyltransferase